MSIVKYTNNKTGVVTWYESTSHYDPNTKQSRPIRKYLGREDPVTGELIPSSGKRGRKSGTSSAQNRNSGRPADVDETALQARVRQLEKEKLSQQSQITALETENRALRNVINKLGLHLDQMNSLYSSVRAEKD